MLPLDDQRRKKSQDLLLCAIEQDSGFHPLLDEFLAGYREFRGEHQSLAADLANDGEFLLKIHQLVLKIRANLANVLQEFRPLENFEKFQRQAALKRADAKGGADRK